MFFFLRLSSKSKSVDKSDEELQFPKELVEDWSAMEVCVDCKKFISEIISSSRHSLVLANKRARLKRKTQSFYMSSAGPSEYCPSERTISEVWALCLPVGVAFLWGHWAGCHCLLTVVNWLGFAWESGFCCVALFHRLNAVFMSIENTWPVASCSSALRGQ